MIQVKYETEAQQIAAAIFEQMGARRFLVMVGARELVAIDKGLQFKLPANFAKDGINMVRVELNEFDTYDVTAGRWAALNFKEKARETGIYCEDLQRVFKRLTGLDTHL